MRIFYYYNTSFESTKSKFVVLVLEIGVWNMVFHWMLFKAIVKCFVSGRT